MKRILTFWPAAVAVAALAAAASLQALGELRPVAPTRNAHLSGRIPARAEGWVMREVPLGANEFIEGEVEKVLNFDDVINREYRRGSIYFGVYVAYWGAGKMPTRMVASHTPDRCWTENGWRCLQMEFRKEKAAGSERLLPGEWRLFEPPEGGKPVHVLYWHLVDGELYDYGARFNAVPSPWLWWKDAFQQVVRGSREQYFIRLTSNVPLESIWEEPGFQEVLRGIAGLGLLSAGSPPAS